MTLQEKLSGLTSKFSLKSIIDFNDQPLFRMPNYMYRMKYWLGAMVAAAFSFEVLSGLFLLLNYYPSDPYNQTEYLIQHIPFGAPILFAHLYGAYFMIFLIYLHLFRNYFDGAYKKPRQFLWVVGLIMFALTLGVAFTGYSLPADVLGVDADGVGHGILAALPGGNIFNDIIFGNGLQISMYTRLLGWHVILTAILGAFVGLHFMIFEQHGVLPSKKVKDKVPAVYPKETWKNFNPWWPRNMLYTVSLLCFVWGLILIVPNVLANINGVPFLFQPAPAPPPTSPLSASIPAFPPWFFLFLYKALDFYTPGGQPYNPAIASLFAAAIPALYLLALPWLDRSEETALHKRPFWTGIGIILITYLIQLTVWSYTAPGVPEPFSIQVGIMFPPLIIAFLSIYAIPRYLESKHAFKKFGNREKVRMQLTPKTAALLGVLVLTVVGTFSAFVSQPYVYTLGIVIPVILTTGLFWKSIVEGTADSATPRAAPERRKMGTGFAFIFMIALLVIAFAMLAELIQIPATGMAATYWGIGTGVILLIFGYALQLYDYVAFPQEDDEVSISASEGRVMMQQYIVTGASDSSEEKED